MTLSDGKTVHVKLLDLQERHDEVNGAVRQAVVRVEVDGQVTNLTSGTYRLPATFGSVQIDCPITKGYLEKSAFHNPWGLLKDARLRLWPAGSPWIVPGTFVYPARQRWFASFTQMANEPVYVDGGDLPAKKEIYYHYGLDMGGSEGLVNVVSATEGIVTSSGNDVLAGQAPDVPGERRYNVVYILDARGWYYRYSHLKFIEPGGPAGRTDCPGPKARSAGQGRGQWRLVPSAFRYFGPSAFRAMGHRRGVCLSLAGISAGTSARTGRRGPAPCPGVGGPDGHAGRFAFTRAGSAP